MYIKFFAWGSSPFASSLCRAALQTDFNAHASRITFARKTDKSCRFQQQWMGWRTLMCGAGQERTMSLANLSVMLNKGRIIFGVCQVQSDKVFGILSSAILLVGIYRRAPTLGVGTCVSVVPVVYSDDGQELAMKFFANKEEKEEELRPMWTSGHQEKYSSSSTPSPKFHQKIVEMDNVKVPSHGKYEQDGAGINDSSLGMTMSLCAEGTVGNDAINAGRLNKNQQKGPNYASLSIECSVHNNSLI